MEVLPHLVVRRLAHRFRGFAIPGELVGLQRRPYAAIAISTSARLTATGCRNRGKEQQEETAAGDH